MAGLLARLFGRREQRDAGPGIGFDLGWWGGSPGIDRRPANALLAENLAAVTACVQLIAGTISALPVTVYRQTGSGRIEQPTHPVGRLITQGPNDRQSWPEWLEMTTSELLRYGNALSIIQHDARGAITGLVPIPWPCVRPVLLDASGERTTPRMAFDVIASWGWFVAMPGIMRRYLDTEVLILRDRSDDGFIGRSRISRSAEVIEGGLGLQTYQLEMWRNGISLSGVLQHPKTLSDPARKRLKTDFQEYRGAHRARRAILLEEGLTWQNVGVSPEDGEVLASRKFSVTEIGRLFNVPPMLLGDFEQTRTANAEFANTLFATYAVLPILRKVEAAFARSVFVDPAMQLDIDMSGLLRGDYAQRWTANVAAVNSGILLANEVRVAEGYAPIPGGDMLRLVPGAKQVPDGTEPPKKPNGKMPNGADGEPEPGEPLLP